MNVTESFYTFCVQLSIQFYSVEEFRVTEACLRARSNGYHFAENRKDLTSQFRPAHIFPLSVNL